MKLLLALCNANDLNTVISQLEYFLACLTQQSTDHKPEICGIWIDPDLVQDPPSVLVAYDDSGKELKLHIPQTSGLAGIWQVCWLVGDDSSTAPKIGRYELLRILIESNEVLRDQPEQRFIPIFPDSHTPEQIQTEMIRLFSDYADWLRPPLQYATQSGRLLTMNNVGVDFPDQSNLA